LLKNAKVLFGQQVPIQEGYGNFSLAWGGHVPGESMIEIFSLIGTAKDLHLLKKGV
jgi:hypothetical protein